MSSRKIDSADVDTCAGRRQQQRGLRESFPCGNKAQPGKYYCKIHDPELMEERERKRNVQAEAGGQYSPAVVRTCQTIAAWVRRYPEPQYYDLLATVDAAMREEQSDSKLLDWLQKQIVDTIYLDDGRIIDVKGGNLRNAIASAMNKSAEEQEQPR